MSNDKEQLFYTENLMPTLEHCVGRWFRICEEATEENLPHECHNFWFGMKAFTKLGIACNNARDRQGAVSFVLTTGVHKRDIAKYIEGKIGVNPMHDETGAW